MPRTGRWRTGCRPAGCARLDTAIVGKLDDYSAELASGIRSVVDGLRRELRGEPVDVAEQRLIRAFSERDIFFSKSSLHWLAQRVADPWWGLKHPLRARRQFREWAREPDLESEAAEAEADEVSHRIDRLLSAYGWPAWSFGATRTYDGHRYELDLGPHSADLADQIRRGPQRGRPRAFPEAMCSSASSAEGTASITSAKAARTSSVSSRSGSSVQKRRPSRSTRA
jgi:hypothetical protein